MDNTSADAARVKRSWGPKEADALIAADGRWHNPRSEAVA